MKTLLKNTIVIFLFLAPFFATAQFLPPGSADFFSEYSGVDIANQECAQPGAGWISFDWIESPNLWKVTDGKFQTGKIYKGTIKNPASLIEMPGGEKLKGLISKGDLAVVRFNTPGEMEIFLPKQKIQMALMGNVDNKTMKFKTPPVKL